MTRLHAAIRGAAVDIADDVTIAPTARLRAGTIRIGKGAAIADGVALSADRIDIGDGSRLSTGVSIVAPEISIGGHSSLAEQLKVEANEAFRLGSLAQIGARGRFVGQSIELGERLWLTDDVVIGGGGARSVRATLKIGARSALMDRSFINLCREVTIGNDSALSNGVVLLTHTMWHPQLQGGPVIAAPVHIGDDVIVYVNAVVAPGVTIGDGCTVAANALVVSDVRDRSLAIGNPARVTGLMPAYPRELAPERVDGLIRSILADYVRESAVKGLTAASKSADVITVAYGRSTETIRYLPFSESTPAGDGADVTLAARSTPQAERGRCHFDLAGGRLLGAASDVSEDLRDFLRRQGIRVFADAPFRSLPPANIARLKARLAADD